MKIESYSIEYPIKGLSKQYAVWVSENNTCYPLIYLQKPKWITDATIWKKIVQSIQLDLPKGIDIK